MPHNSRQCWPILIILSLLHYPMNCRKSWNKIYHLTSNMLPHYFVKIEYIQHFVQCKCDAKSFIYNILSASDAKFCLLCLNRLIYNVAACVKLVCPQHTVSHVYVKSCMLLVNGCVSDALLNATVQNVLQAQSHNIPVMLNDVRNTEKIINKLKINQINRNTS